MTQFHEHMQTIVNPVMNFMSHIDAPVLDVKVNVPLKHIIPLKWISNKLKGCTWTVHDLSDIKLTNILAKDTNDGTYKSVAEIISSNNTYLEGQYRMFDEVLIACDKDESNDSSPMAPIKHWVPFFLGYFKLQIITARLEDCIWTNV